MKKIILLSVIVLLLIPGTASALSLDPPTIIISGDGLSFTIIFGGVLYYKVTFCNGDVDAGFYFPLNQGADSNTFYYDKLIAQVEVYPPPPLIPINGAINSIPGPINGAIAVASRNCEAADPLFMMWLLTRGDQGCILLSETHPSVERQRALCFPATDPDWTADNAPCADYVYSNDTWSCDAFGFSRLPLYDEDGPDLMEVWQRHAARQ
jgi:hypothetical protein